MLVSIRFRTFTVNNEYSSRCLQSMSIQLGSEHVMDMLINGCRLAPIPCQIGSELWSRLYKI